MKPGQILRCFKARDGREVVLRAPQWRDLDDLLEFINSLVEEEADICREKKATREEEADWLGRSLADIEKGAMIGIVAEIEGRSWPTPKLRGKADHESCGLLGDSH